jgi:hypothetical protein
VHPVDHRLYLPLWRPPWRSRSRSGERSARTTRPASCRRGRRQSVQAAMTDDRRGGRGGRRNRGLFAYTRMVPTSGVRDRSRFVDRSRGQGYQTDTGRRWQHCPQASRTLHRRRPVIRLVRWSGGIRIV